MITPSAEAFDDARAIAGFFCRRLGILHLVVDVAAVGLANFCKSYDAARGESSMYLTVMVKFAAIDIARSDFYMRRVRASVTASPWSQWQPMDPETALLRKELRGIARVATGADFRLFGLEREQHGPLALALSQMKGTTFDSERSWISRRKKRAVERARRALQIRRPDAAVKRRSLISSASKGYPVGGLS